MNAPDGDVAGFPFDDFLNGPHGAHHVEEIESEEIDVHAPAKGLVFSF
jgi:hypothetical protein